MSKEKLAMGSKGASVKELQKILGITEDGKFGKNTKAAVKAFQLANGLVSDGVVGVKTWAALLSAKPPVVSNPVKPGAKLLYWPNAVIRKDLKKKGRGSYSSESGLSVGSIVHYTAGNYKKGLQNAISSIEGSPYYFHCIATDGSFVQANPLNQWGHHAGESSWVINGKRVDGVSDYLDGIEMNNPGILTKIGSKYYAYYDLKSPIPDDQVRVITKDKHNVQKAAYMKYTSAQEKTLIEYLLWRKFNDPENYNFDYVLGHDEVAGNTVEDDEKKGYGLARDRKNDPGGALSMTMPELRSLLKKEYAKRIK